MKINSKRKIKTNFKDNRERFRLMNGLPKKPHIFMFFSLSIVATILAIIPLVWKDSYFSLNGVLFWGFGLSGSILFELFANYHYWKYSRVANSRNINSIVKNVRFNKILRTISMFSWILIGISIAMIAINKTSNFLDVF